MERSAKDRRLMWIVGAVIAVVCLLIALFAYRPVVLVGVSGQALAHSIGGGDIFGSSRCEEVPSSDYWRCQISDSSSGSAEYSVEVGSSGCWDAERRGPGGEGGTPREAEGCIDGFDVLSPF